MSLLFLERQLIYLIISRTGCVPVYLYKIFLFLQIQSRVQNFTWCTGS